MAGVPPFARRVYEELLRVPAGETVSYGELAARLGDRRKARAVANALAVNPFAPRVPCHRVVQADGTIGGFSGAGGLAAKARLLHAEGVAVRFRRDRPSPFRSLFEPEAFDIGVRSLAAGDRAFAALYRKVGHVPLGQERPGNPFAALLEAICYQQLAGKAAASIFRRFCLAVPELMPAAVLAAGEDRIRAAGVSAGKCSAMLGLATAFQAGRIDPAAMLRMSREEIEEALLAVRGIGPWTVQMFEIFHLGLPDVFPENDLGIRKMTAVALGRKGILSPKECACAGERWRPLRTIATWYLWKSSEQPMLGSGG